MSIQMAGPWITEHEEKIVLDALRNGWYGDKAYYYVELFESEFAKHHGRKYALMTPNCTTALHLLLAGLGIGEGDEVIAPECTWIGSTACVTYQRAIPVFADIDPVSWCLTSDTIWKAVTPRTKAIIAVDLYGNMPDWDAILDLGVTVIEDAAEALGSTYKSRRAGSFGIASVFSFHRTKTLTTGEGGMLLTDDDKLYKRCKFLRDHGRKPGTYYNTEVTFKYMPFNLQAALGHAQFQRLDELIAKKRWILHGYKERLADISDLQFNMETNEVYNGAWNTVLVFGKSHKITWETAIPIRLSELKLPSRPFFYPLSCLPAYPGRKKDRDNPVSYDVSSRGICLPSALNMTDYDLDRMCEGIRKILGYQ